MNLSDTSRESSVSSSRLGEVENEIEHQPLNLSVTSSIQSSTNADGLNVQDLVAENQRLTQENDDLKRRIADLEAAGGGEGGGGVPDANNAHSKPWPELSKQWKRLKTKAISSELDSVALKHQTTPVTVAANMLKRKAKMVSRTDIWRIAKRIEDGLPIDSNNVPFLVASWLCVRSNRTGLGQRVYTKIKTVFRRNDLCNLPPHKELFSFWKNTMLTPIEASTEGTSEVFSSNY